LSNHQQKILVTGANGQLGKALQAIAGNYPQYEFLYTDIDNLLIDDAVALTRYFDEHEFQFCINCAAYTAVDKAESEPEQAFLLNATAVGNLATNCNRKKVQLIHISTDYVFDGNGTIPYPESATTHPTSVYGASKLKGEILVQESAPNSIIIRTAWLYSEFGNNFVKTMLRLMKEKESINVVNDQIGSPTYAGDLAEAIMQMLQQSNALNQEPSANKIFHYCNSGIISWYDFAVAIQQHSKSNCQVNPVPSSAYPTAAKRPAYSVLDTKKIRKTLSIPIPQWEGSLEKCLQRLPASA